MPTPLENVLLKRQSTPQGVQLPTQGPQTWLDPVLRGVDTALGLEQQKPGDLASALGAGAAAGVSLMDPSLAREQGAKTLQYLMENAKELDLSDNALNAIKFAQQRWPRLFGHVPNWNGWVSTNEKTGVPNWGNQNEIGPSMQQLLLRNSPMQKTAGALSSISINPNLSASDSMNTVGHEMLHAADSLAMTPNQTDMPFTARERYEESKKLPTGFEDNTMLPPNTLPTGYDLSSQELRAKLQGGKTVGYSEGRPRGSFDVTLTGPKLNTVHIQDKPVAAEPSVMQKAWDYLANLLPNTPPPK